MIKIFLLGNVLQSTLINYFFTKAHILNFVTLFEFDALRGAKITLLCCFLVVLDISFITGLSSESSNGVLKVLAEEDFKLHKESPPIGLIISILCAIRSPLISKHTRTAYL